MQLNNNNNKSDKPVSSEICSNFLPKFPALFESIVSTSTTTTTSLNRSNVVSTVESDVKLGSKHIHGLDPNIISYSTVNHDMNHSHHSSNSNQLNKSNLLRPIYLQLADFDFDFDESKLKLENLEPIKKQLLF